MLCYGLRIKDGLSDFAGNGVGDGWWEGVADLAVGGGFASGEMPIVGEALDSGCHAECEAGHTSEAFWRGFVAE